MGNFNIYKYIYTYFHVYFYLFLHIYSYLHIFLHIFTYIYHKSVVFYNSLPHKCGILLRFTTKVWYFSSVYHKSVEVEMYPKMGYKLTMYPKYPTWGTDGVQKLVLPKMANI